MYSNKLGEEIEWIEFLFRILHKFCYLSMQCDVQLNRKVLSELAIHEPKTFQVCISGARAHKNGRLE